MPQEIYNEGRVVGLSAWEIFYKQAIGNGVDPSQVPNEPQWLASMIGMGSSMVLRLDAGISGIVDIDLPSGSNLAAAGVIIANPFMGNCTWDDNSPWATKVTSYSGLIQNTAEHNPTSGDVPYDSNYTDQDYIDCVTEFTKLTDGIVYIKNANWIPTPSGTTPVKDIDPNFNNSVSAIRLYVASPLTKEVRILLVGFIKDTTFY